jgi:hypothetical protein
VLLSNGPLAQLEEQVTLNHSVQGSSPWRLTYDRTGVFPIKSVTLVTWAFAPQWLTIEEASILSGQALDTLGWMIEDGAVDARRDGAARLIEKASLWEFQEALLEVLQMSEDEPPD